jgi:fused signal recognition particle receptor
MKLKNFFKTSLKKQLSSIFTGGKDREEILEDVEELLILSDISIDLVGRILTDVRKKSKRSFDKDEFLELFREEIKEIFAFAESKTVRTSGHAGEGKNVIMLVGINGSGKTTSAAKLAHYFKNRGKKVLMGAADTFRAAGSSQLSLWGERLDIPVIGAERGADPGSVVYNSMNSFVNKGYDTLIIDTAGRVQTKDNLMKELEKLTKIIKKFVPEGPDDTLLVVDATMGQNTLDQAKRFKEFSGISGLLLSKLDGTAKGGTVLNIIDEMKIPVKYVGTGERESNLELFHVDDFVDSLLSD